MAAPWYARRVFRSPPPMPCGQNENSHTRFRARQELLHEGMVTMKRNVPAAMRKIGTAACVLVLVSAAPASAQQWSRKTTGIVTLSAGVGLVFAAFDFTFDVCPEGYSTHTYQNQPTQCLYVSPSPPFDTDVRDATTEATLSHPKLAWTGLGAIALGAVLLTLPDNRVTRDLDVQVSPARVAVRRRFGW